MGRTPSSRMGRSFNLLNPLTSTIFSRWSPRGRRDKSGIGSSIVGAGRQELFILIKRDGVNGVSAFVDQAATRLFFTPCSEYRFVQNR
jgi:hypothetical protein